LKERLRRYLWNPFNAVTLILGSILTVQAFHPRLTLTPSEPVDVRNPFSVTFTVTNQSWFKVRKVVFVVGLGEVIGRDSPRELKGVPKKFDLRFTRDDIWRLSRMKPDDQFTLIPADAMRAAEPDGVKAAVFAVIVDYSPRWIWFYRPERIYPFVTYRASDGHLHWAARPLE
jgi:hypothetical protein